MTPEERAERICEFLRHNGVCPTFCTRCRTRFAIAAALHEYGDERAAAERERCIRIAEEQRLKILAREDDPSWTEHLAEVQSRIRGLPTDRPAGRAEEERMRKRDELTNPSACMVRARDDEMTFVLLGRDAAAPVAIRAWIAERIRLGKNQPGDPQLTEAEQCARTMESER